MISTWVLYFLSSCEQMVNETDYTLSPEPA